MNRERLHRVFKGVSLFLVTLALTAFAFVTLPEALRKAGAVSLEPKTVSSSPSLSSLLPELAIPTKQRALTRVHGTVAKFVPEGMPQESASPSAQAQGTSSVANANDPAWDIAAGGAGAAIDEDESYQVAHREISPKPTDPAPSAAPASPGSMDFTATTQSVGPQVRELKNSSFARNERPSTDTEKGRREKPWLSPPPGLEADVAFWHDIYAKYDRNMIVLHHPRHLQIVYEVVDLNDIDRDPRLNAIEKSHLRESRVNDRRQYYVEILKKLATTPMASTLTDDEWRVRKLYDGIREADAFRRAAEEDGVRSQTGQRDKFVRGIGYSGRYLGEIESIFESYGLPRELTRIIFVESMFNLKARSSVGASGIWQFMKNTGKLYLNVNEIVDERNDPIAATHAAAKLLRHNYEVLGTWPLAINAYNAGRGRLQQAVATLGTTDIGRIIRGFSHPAYGFASRNFFLEYLAAYDVAEHAEKYFGPVTHEQPLKFETVQTPYTISLPQVARIANISPDEMEEYNPRFTDAILSGVRPLPGGYEVRVAPGKGQLFLAAASRAPGSKTGPTHHVVQAGETLPTIAAMYGVSPATLLKSNQHVSRNLVAGQKLVIPQRAAQNSARIAY